MWRENIYSPGDCDSFKNLLELGIDYDESESNEDFLYTIFSNRVAIETRKNHIIKMVQRLMNEYCCLEELENSAVQRAFTDSE